MKKYYKICKGTQIQGVSRDSLQGEIVRERELILKEAK